VLPRPAGDRDARKDYTADFSRRHNWRQFALLGAGLSCPALGRCIPLWHLIINLSRSLLLFFFITIAAECWRGKPLYAAILETLKAAGLAGATLLRGVAGFGTYS
jgi:hypothetical protein